MDRIQHHLDTANAFIESEQLRSMSQSVQNRFTETRDYLARYIAKRSVVNQAGQRGHQLNPDAA